MRLLIEILYKKSPAWKKILTKASINQNQTSHLASEKNVQRNVSATVSIWERSAMYFESPLKFEKMPHLIRPMATVENRQPTPRGKCFMTRSHGEDGSSQYFFYSGLLITSVGRCLILADWCFREIFFKYSGELWDVNLHKITSRASLCFQTAFATLILTLFVEVPSLKSKVRLFVPGFLRVKTISLSGYSLTQMTIFSIIFL